MDINVSDELAMKLHFNEDSFAFDNEIVSLLLEIEEFKGSWKAFGNLAPTRLTELKRIATIESIGSSTRIEGSKLTDLEVSKIMEGLSKQSFRKRDEQEVAGYAMLMNEIFESWEEMPLTENIIKQMHSILMRPSSKDERHRGAYKTIDNSIAAFDSKGHAIGVVFETTSASDTPRYMKQLVDWTNRLLFEKKLPSLIVIGMFVVSFLAIHPFQDGNGRLSRALTTLLLLRSGYLYAPYSSLESVIEASKDNYYIALRTTQKTLQKAEPNWDVWLFYFLKSLVKQKKNLEKKIQEEHLLRVMPEISLRIIEKLKSHGPMDITQMAKLLNVNKFTLRDYFKRLVKESYLIKLGSGRATKYDLANFAQQ